MPDVQRLVGREPAEKWGVSVWVSEIRGDLRKCLGGEHDGAEQEGNTSDLAALHFVLGKQLS